MKQIHYQNIGFPRSGSTWLWESLVKHPKVFKSTNIIKTRNFTNSSKEPRFGRWTTEKIINRIPLDVNPIKDKYMDYDISMCFNQFDFLCNAEEISRIAEYTTHASLVIRNPFEVTSNYFAYAQYNFPNRHTIPQLIDMFDFSNTVEKWIPFKNKFKVFVYDDLLADQDAFYNSVCDFIGIEPNKSVPNRVNSINDYMTGYEQVTYTDEQIATLNGHVDKLSGLLNRDFSHWKV